MTRILTTDPDFADLLQRAGFRVRGRRADCIHCDGQSRLTVAFTDEVAFCHRCKWTGNFRTLSRELGLPLAPETREARERRVRAAQFDEWLVVCHLLLIRRLRYLTRRAELAKSILGAYPECEPAWNAVADFYHSEAELFGGLDTVSFEKLSAWRDVPMSREKLFAAFEKSGGQIGARNAA